MFMRMNTFRAKTEKLVLNPRLLRTTRINTSEHISAVNSLDHKKKDSCAKTCPGGQK